MRLRLVLALTVAALCAIATPAHAVPDCFAAAARDPRAPCSNPALRFAARPGLARSLITPTYPCTGNGAVGDPNDRADGALFVCEFGVPAAMATRTVALIGDSHAMAWRAAVAGAMKLLGWHGIDLTRSHCAFSATIRELPETAEVQGCVRFNVRVVRWLRDHPEVSAAFVAHQTAGTAYYTAPGQNSFESEQLGFELAWQALPPSILQVFAIRDNPAFHNAYAVAACVRRARRADADAGAYCARPRKQSLRRDAYPGAIDDLNEVRYELIDLTKFFCSAQSCFPVVGGALVTKDGRHLTRLFSASLGPYLARAVRAVLSPYSPPPPQR